MNIVYSMGFDQFSAIIAIRLNACPNRIVHLLDDLYSFMMHLFGDCEIRLLRRTSPPRVDVMLS